jgi:imidazolonepropionase-like amidohydrolase
MARRGTALVPTMINVERFDDIASQAGSKFPGYAAHMLKLKAGFPAIVAAAYEAGVPIYVGTDAGGGIGHGEVVAEMLRLRAAGMSTMDVLRAGSWGAREWLGFPGLVEGGLADLLVFDQDPRQELAVLRAPVVSVLRGRVLATR